MSVTIKIIDTGADRYLLKASSRVLGRRNDSGSDTITVEKPEAETNSICTMVVYPTFTNVKLEYNVGLEPVTIDDEMSQYDCVKIGFIFKREDNTIKSSELKVFKFLESSNKDGEPASTTELKEKAFCNMEQLKDRVNFKNISDVIKYTLFLATKVSKDSAYPVTSQAVYEALQDIQLDFDEEPTKDSKKAVYSGGLFNSFEALKSAMAVLDSIALAEEGIYVNYKNGTQLLLPLALDGDLTPVLKDDKLYIVGTQSITITLTGSGQVKGTITADQLSVLQSKESNYIIVDNSEGVNEVYYHQTNSADNGTRLYTHTKFENGVLTSKTLVITISTRAFTIQEQSGIGDLYLTNAEVETTETESTLVITKSDGTQVRFTKSGGGTGGGITYRFETGSVNGTFKVIPSEGTSYEVEIKGWDEKQDRLSEKNKLPAEYVDGIPNKESDLVHDMGYVSEEYLKEQGYTTETWVNNQGFLKNDALEPYRTRDDQDNIDAQMQAEIDNVREIARGKKSGYVIDLQSDIVGDKDEETQDYTNVTKIGDLDLTKLEIGVDILIKEHSVPDYWVSQIEPNIELIAYENKQDLKGYATEAWVLAQNYANHEELDKKQDQLTVEQLNAVNSGINSAGVKQIVENANSIAILGNTKQDKLSSTNAGKNVTITEKDGIPVINALPDITNADGVLLLEDKDYGTIISTKEWQAELKTTYNDINSYYELPSTYIEGVSTIYAFCRNNYSTPAGMVMRRGVYKGTVITSPKPHYSWGRMSDVELVSELPDPSSASTSYLYALVESGDVVNVVYKISQTVQSHFLANKQNKLVEGTGVRIDETDPLHPILSADEPEEYLKKAEISEDGNTLTLTDKQGKELPFTPKTGGEPNEYLKSAEISEDGNTLTLIDKQGSKLPFSPKTGEPSEYLRGAKVSGDGNTLTLFDKDGNEVSFSPNGSETKPLFILHDNTMLHAFQVSTERPVLEFWCTWDSYYVNKLYIYMDVNSHEIRAISSVDISTTYLAYNSELDRYYIGHKNPDGASRQLLLTWYPEAMQFTVIGSHDDVDFYLKEITYKE